MYVKVFVGFGGSGGKTLANLARLVADDAALADSGRRFFSFLLIDTHRQDLMAAQAEIRKQFDRAGAGQPHVEIMDLSANVDRLQDLVDARLGPTLRRVRGGSASSPPTTRDYDELEEAETHWWFDSERVPFSGRSLPSPISRGAGQCPLAAHFVAWDKLPELTEHLNNIKAQILRRHNENEPVELYLVGSLAGGTGRGCWALLSLKAREVFRSCTPTTYFFDASVFREVERKYPEQRLRLHVNSLTGLSEVAGWLRNDGRSASAGGQRRFFVPDLRGLATDRMAIDTDRIAHAVTQPHLTGRTPVQNCFVISRGSDSVQMSSESEAYSVAAAALYSRLASPGIEGAFANQIQIGTCCAAIARVPITEIRECIRQLAVFEAVHALRAVDVGLVEAAVAALVTAFEFSDPEADAIHKHGSASSLVGAFAQAMVNLSDMKLLCERMTADDFEGVLEAVKTGKYAAADRHAVATAVRTALLERLGATAGDWESAIRAKIETEIARFFNGAGAIGCAAETVRRSIEVLNSFIRHLNPITDFKSPGEKAARGKLEEEVRATGRQRLPFIERRWDEDDVKAAARVMTELWLQENQAEAIAVLRETLEAAKSIFMEYDRALAVALRVVDRVQANADGEYAKRKPLVFLSDDAQELLSQLPKWTSSSGKLQRVLRPPLREGAFRDIVRGKRVLGSPALARQLGRFQDLVRSAVLDRHERAMYRSEEFRAAQADQFAKELGSTVANTLEIPTDVLAAEFGLMRVLGDIESHLRKVIESHLGQAALVTELQDACEALLGRRFEMKPDRSAPGLVPMSAEDLLGELAYSLATKCDPMLDIDWNTLGEGGTPRTVWDRAEVFVPCAGLSADAIATRIDRIQRLSEDIKTERICDRRKFFSNTVHQYSVAADKDSEFTIVAYTILTLPDFDRSAWDPVQSFRYWQADPEISKWLNRCEDPEGASVWERSSGNLGLGYIHPSFVRNAAWQALRWRPWIASGAAQVEANQRIDTLLYALAGNILESEDAESREARGLRDAIARHQPNPARDQGWTMPILQRNTGSDAGWRFTRRSFAIDGFGTINAVGGSWRGGQSFSTLRGFLQWLGDPKLRRLSSEGNEFMNALSKERRLVGQSVVSRIEADFGEKRRASLTKALAAFLDDYRSNYLADRTEEQRMVEGPIVDALLARVISGGWSWERES